MEKADVPLSVTPIKKSARLAEPPPEELDDWDVQPAIDWLMREGRLMADPAEMFGRLADRLVAAGAPLARMTLGLQTIHPQYRTMGMEWRRGAEKVTQQVRPHGIENSPAYIGSPIQEVAEGRKPVRYRLDKIGPQHHAALHDLAALGGTDYYAAPMRVATGRQPALTFMTDRPDGFFATDLAKFHRLIDYLAPIVESRIGQRISNTLLDTYLGKIVGEQILSGLIKRGDGTEINAVLWFSDLRDFTD